MIKNLTVIEHTIGNKVFQFLCHPESSTVDCKEALFEVLKYIGQIEDAVKKAQAEQKPSEQPAAVETPIAEIE